MDAASDLIVKPWRGGIALCRKSTAWDYVGLTLAFIFFLLICVGGVIYASFSHAAFLIAAFLGAISAVSMFVQMIHRVSVLANIDGLFLPGLFRPLRVAASDIIDIKARPGDNFCNFAVTVQYTGGDDVLLDGISEKGMEIAVQQLRNVLTSDSREIDVPASAAFGNGPNAV